VFETQGITSAGTEMAI